MTDGVETAVDGPTLSEPTLRYAEELTDSLLGVDRLYRTESSDEAGLAVLDTSDGRSAESFEGYAAADARFAELAELADGLPEADRRLYYRQVCASTRAFIEWRTEGLPFAEQVRRFLHVPAAPPDEDELERLRTETSDALAAAGHEGSLRAACRAWERAERVPADEAPRVLSELLSEGRERLLEHVDVPSAMLPEPTARGVSGVGFNAKCEYPDGVVVNTDPTLTRPWLRALAIHEGYPGHFMQFALRTGWYYRGDAPADGLLSVVNTASSATFEGIADAGLNLPPERPADRVARLLRRYRTAIATVAAWRYHGADDDADEVRSYLNDAAILADEGWVNNRIDFLTAPERATLMYSYWYGEPAVSEAIEAVSPEELPALVRFLYGRLHSTDTVGMFGEHRT